MQTTCFLDFQKNLRVSWLNECDWFFVVVVVVGFDFDFTHFSHTQIQLTTFYNFKIYSTPDWLWIIGMAKIRNINKKWEMSKFNSQISFSMNETSFEWRTHSNRTHRLDKPFGNRAVCELCVRAHFVDCNNIFVKMLMIYILLGSNQHLQSILQNLTGWNIQIAINRLSSQLLLTFIAFHFNQV